jgi:apoptosis-inducing factor 2
MIPDDKIFFPIAAAFEKYPSDRYEIILGKAESLDPSGNRVIVATNSGERRTVSYDSVVVATGSSFIRDLPLKNLTSTEETQAKRRTYKERIRKAKSIVVAGGGITGVELTGELSTEYPDKDITLIVDGDLPLAERYMRDVREVARNELDKLKASLIMNTRVHAVTSPGPDGPFSIELSREGTKQIIQADLFLPTYGVVPNTDFMPAGLLDSQGYIYQTTYLRARGYDNIFVVGDAGNLQPPSGSNAEEQCRHLVKILDAYLIGDPLPEFHPSTKITLGMSIGRHKGTGQVGDWRPWGFLFTYMKSRTLLTEVAPGYVAGTRMAVARSWT